MLTFEQVIALLANPAEITDEQWTQINEALASFDTDQLAEFETTLRATFDTVNAEPRTAESVALMGRIRDVISATTAEGTRREDEQERLDEEAERIRAEVAGETPPEGEGETPPEGEGEGDGTETPPEGEGETPAGEETPPAEQEGEAPPAGEEAPPGTEAVAAAGTPTGTPSGTGRARVGDIGRRVPAARQPVRLDARPALVAGADLPGVSAGGRFRNAEHIAEVMHRKIEATKRVEHGEWLVASIEYHYPAARQLGDDPVVNGRIIDAVTRPDVLVAAGGFCAPVAVRYDLLNLSVADRPVRDAFAGFEATRGGIRWIEPPVIGDLDAAVREWTVADDEAAALDPPGEVKPCVRVTCGNEVEALIYGVPLCLTFGNMGARTFPEQIATNNDLGLSTHARFADTLLLGKFDALNGQKDVTSAQVLGATRDLLYVLGVMADYYRNKYRTSRTQRFGVLLPDWAKGVIRADLLRAMGTDNNGHPARITDEQIETLIRDLGYNPRWHYDGAASEMFANQADGMANVEYPAEVKWRMWPEGSVLFLDGGRLDFGIVRDSETNKTNDYKTQFETFEGLAHVGREVLTVTSTVCPSGASAGTLAPACP